MVTSPSLNKVRGSLRYVSSAESARPLGVPRTEVEAVTREVVKSHTELGAHDWINDVLEHEIVCKLRLLALHKCKLSYNR